MNSYSKQWIMSGQVYRGTDCEIPAHITGPYGEYNSMKVNTLFQGITGSCKPDLYAFVVNLSRKSESIIQTKQTSAGIVNDLCDILHAMYGVEVASLIGPDITSWVVVCIGREGVHAFLDMRELSQNSPEKLGLTGFFERKIAFLDHFFENGSQCVPLVRCLHCMQMFGVDSHEEDVTSTTQPPNVSSIASNDAFPWAVCIDTNNSKSILHNVMSALCAFTFALSVKHLVGNAQRCFIMRKRDEAIALVNFEANEDAWLPIGTRGDIPCLDKFTMMLTHAEDYGIGATEMRKQLLIYFSRIYLKQTENIDIPIEPAECYMWHTYFKHDANDSFLTVLFKEKQIQEAKCYKLKTMANTTLPIILDNELNIYRGLLVNDTHGRFGSVVAFREYVMCNMIAMLKATASATEDEGVLVNLLTLWELLFGFIVQEVHTYMRMCSWMARDVFFAIIGMYKQNKDVIELRTFLKTIESIQCVENVSGDIALIRDSVLFLMMPTEAQCLSAKAFRAVVAVDPVHAAIECWNHAFQHFITRTYATQQEEVQGAVGHVEKPYLMDEDMCFRFPDDVSNSDKATLYTLLRFRGLQHLLAFSPLVPRDKLWLSAIVTERADEDIFLLADKALFVGMTSDLLVYVLYDKLHITKKTESQHIPVGFILISDVINAYNLLASNTMPNMKTMKYTNEEVVLLFKIFNVGYRETKCGRKVMDEGVLLKAMLHILFGINPMEPFYVGSIWSDVLDFLLSGAISHEPHGHPVANDNSCMEVQFSDTNIHCLDTMLEATHELYLDRVEIVEVVPDYIYMLLRSTRSTFIVAPAVLEKHEHLIRNVELKNVINDPVTVGVLVSMILISLGLCCESRTINNIVQVHKKIVSRHSSPNPIPFIVRQVLRVLWNGHHHLYFPDIKPDNQHLILKWERNIQDRSMPFYHSVIGVILVHGRPTDSTLLVLDETVSVLVQRGIGCSEKATASMLITDWPLVNSWETYINDKESLISALNVYKDTHNSHPLLSLLGIDDTFTQVWKINRNQYAMNQLLLKDWRLFLDSVLDLVKNITNKTTSTKDSVLKVLDKAMADEAITLVTGGYTCAMQVLTENEPKHVLVIPGYPFALLDESIALHFDKNCQFVNLQGTVNDELMLITDALMGTEGMTQNAEAVIEDTTLCNWLLACMPKISVDKQRRVALLFLNDMLDEVHTFWTQNKGVFDNSVADAVKNLMHYTVTNDVFRKFINDIVSPCIDTINKHPDMGACLLLEPSSLSDYCILCTRKNVKVGILGRDKNKQGELTKWLQGTRILMSKVECKTQLLVFVQKCRDHGAPPVGGDATKQVFANMPNYLISEHLHELVDTVARASILNAWTTDVPALEIYARDQLICLGHNFIDI